MHYIIKIQNICFRYLQKADKNFVSYRSNTTELNSYASSEFKAIKLTIRVSKAKIIWTKFLTQIIIYVIHWIVFFSRFLLKKTKAYSVTISYIQIVTVIVGSVHQTKICSWSWKKLEKNVIGFEQNSNWINIFCLTFNDLNMISFIMIFYRIIETHCKILWNKQNLTEKYKKVYEDVTIVFLEENCTI